MPNQQLQSALLFIFVYCLEPLLLSLTLKRLQFWINHVCFCYLLYWSMAIIPPSPENRWWELKEKKRSSCSHDRVNDLYGDIFCRRAYLRIAMISQWARCSALLPGCLWTKMRQISSKEPRIGTKFQKVCFQLFYWLNPQRSGCLCVAGAAFHSC